MSQSASTSSFLPDHLAPSPIHAAAGPPLLLPLPSTDAAQTSFSLPLDTLPTGFYLRKLWIVFFFPLDEGGKTPLFPIGTRAFSM